MSTTLRQQWLYANTRTYAPVVQYVNGHQDAYITFVILGRSYQKAMSSRGDLTDASLSYVVVYVAAKSW